jgi:hypothetical protein
MRARKVTRLATAGGLSRSAGREISFPRMYAAVGCRLISSVKPFQQQKQEHVDLQKPTDLDTVNRLVEKYRDN